MWRQQHQPYVHTTRTASREPGKRGWGQGRNQADGKGVGWRSGTSVRGLPTMQGVKCRKVATAGARFLHLITGGSFHRDLRFSSQLPIPRQSHAGILTLEGLIIAAQQWIRGFGHRRRLARDGDGLAGKPCAINPRPLSHQHGNQSHPHFQITIVTLRVNTVLGEHTAYAPQIETKLPNAARRDVVFSDSLLYLRSWQPMIVPLMLDDLKYDKSINWAIRIFLILL